jgi:hypothetical protein
MTRRSKKPDPLFDRVRRTLLALLVVEPLGRLAPVATGFGVPEPVSVGPTDQQVTSFGYMRLMAAAVDHLPTGAGMAYIPARLKCPITQSCHAPNTLQHHPRLPSTSRGFTAAAG